MLAVDRDERVVGDWADWLVHVVQADATDGVALRQVGVQEHAKAVVGIGADLEASVLTVLTLADLGVAEIWAKAVTAAHGRVLSAVGAHHGVYPEAAVGRWTACAISARVIDYVEFDDGDAVATTRAPADGAGDGLVASALGARYGIVVVGVKRAGAGFCAAGPDTRVHAGDVVVVAGRSEHVQRFAAAT